MAVATAVPGVGKSSKKLEPGSDYQLRGPARAAIVPSSRTDVFIAALAFAGIVAHLTLRYGFDSSFSVQFFPLFIALGLGGLPLVVRLIRKIFARQFGSDFLAGLSIAVSVVMGQYLVGTIVVLMLSGGTALEVLATRRASSVLERLAKRMPQSAHQVSAGEIIDVPIGSVAIGQTLLVLPHEICPVDGVVLAGRGRMNEAYLTGEPFEISKTPGSEVLSGAINGEAALTILVEKLAADSRYAKIMQVMEETQQRRPRLRRLGDMLGAWYTPLAVAAGLAAWIFSGNPNRFLAVLVIATPCPLLLAIPVAVIGAISLSAKRGIIIKNPAILEQINQCKTLIFDKTGTLTYGRPSMTEMLCAPGMSENTVLQFAASLERYSKHPLAGAILDAASAAGIRLVHATEISEKQGEGLRGKVAGQDVWITGRNNVTDRNPWLPKAVVGLECVLFISGKYAATFRFRDVARTGGRSFVNHLGPRHSFKRVLLVSGDRELEVQYLANVVGIAEVHASKSPEEKVRIVAGETKNNKTLFIGDGINDAPAMQAATVGISFGTSNDITVEAADAVILDASLDKVDELMHIGRRMRSIALASALGGMALSVIGMTAAALGWLLPIEGAVAQEVIDLLAVLNAVRVAFPFRGMKDF